MAFLEITNHAFSARKAVLTQLYKSFLKLTDMPPQCSRCTREAVYFRCYTEEKLCKRCLLDTTLDKIRETINQRGMFKRDDRIIVALSGGKDSAVLLDTLVRIEAVYPETELCPVTIDEGITGYRDEALKTAEELTSNLSLNLTVLSFKDLFGYSLDEIVANREENGLGACSYCGILRRRAINNAARKIDGNVITTGHNLDDEAQTAVMNVLRGDAHRIGRMNRTRGDTMEGFIPRVKPITRLSERDIVAYAHHFSLPYHDAPCPYAHEAYRNDVRQFLNRMEQKRPGTLLGILGSSEKIAEAMRSDTSSSQFNSCTRCGNPTSAKVCRVCKILEKIGEAM